MITEAVMLHVEKGREQEYEEAFREASTYISSMDGYISHELKRCLEVDGKYLMLIYWQTLEDHTIGFRESDEYKEWSRLLHPFYDPHPTVEHFEKVDLG
ncbi:antibiotic biosynthesis monooxygenase [Halobacillus sp. ACCC02827]|nr:MULTISPECIES: antibiotic biosynthesis monooxygenase [Bacillaceae]QHT48424.1 antibiotic biosynthesis monooxygenase [Bacillus sp. SB49]WJE15658.1 antibiotic biosynthesis monooxygenase [Halobacillus sp. ACCC02827]